MSRTLTGARARQLKRRLHRASLHNVEGAPPAKAVDTRESAIRMQLAVRRNELSGLASRHAHVSELVGRLEARLRRATT